jgi:hypothetical protein
MDRLPQQTQEKLLLWNQPELPALWMHRRAANALSTLIFPCYYRPVFLGCKAPQGNPDCQPSSQRFWFSRSRVKTRNLPFSRASRHHWCCGTWDCMDSPLRWTWHMLGIESQHLYFPVLHNCVLTLLLHCPLRSQGGTHLCIWLRVDGAASICLWVKLPHAELTSQHRLLHITMQGLKGHALEVRSELIASLQIAKSKCPTLPLSSVFNVTCSVAQCYM